MNDTVHESGELFFFMQKRVSQGEENIAVAVFSGVMQPVTYGVRCIYFNT